MRADTESQAAQAARAEIREQALKQAEVCKAAINQIDVAREAFFAALDEAERVLDITESTFARLSRIEGKPTFALEARRMCEGFLETIVKRSTVRARAMFTAFLRAESVLLPDDKKAAA